MNYSYEIKDVVVNETINSQFKNWTFSLEELIENQKYFLSSEHLRSYTRTREWISQNYPELLL